MNLLHKQIASRISIKMMSELVSMQIAFLVKPFGTIWIRANKWFFACMNPHMSFQIEIQRKPLVAQVALVWFFTL